MKWPADIASTLNAAFGSKLGLEDQHINGGAPLFVPIALAENTIGRQPHNGGNGDGFAEGGPMYMLNATGVHGVAQPITFGAQMSTPQTDVDLVQTLQAKNPMAVAQPIDFRNLRYHEGEVAGTMQAKATGGFSLNYMTGVQQHMAVRRLTPVECERLQGFPDEYTNIPWRKAIDSPDGPRYKALGNSMAVPVMKWIGERIKLTMPKPAG